MHPVRSTLARTACACVGDRGGSELAYLGFSAFHTTSERVCVFVDARRQRKQRVSMLGGAASLGAALVTCAAASFAESFQCRVCGEHFKSRHGLSIHFGRKCKRRTRRNLDWQEMMHDCAAEDDTPRSDAAQRRAAIFRKAQRSRILDDLTRFRYDLFMPSSHVDQFKSAVATWTLTAKEELLRRLSPLVSDGHQLNLKSIVHTTLDLFNGIRTGHQEEQLLRTKLPLLKLEPRVLGPPRTLYVKDAEGNVFRSKQVTDVAYDIPIDASLCRLLQEDAKAWDMVQKTMREWSKTPPPRGESQVICDIVDGSVFYNHSVLGDAARKARIEAGDTQTIHLALILYYDDLTVPNGLGNAALKHNYAMFYYALVNLDPSVRMSLKYIQLATVCYSSDLKRYGASTILGGGADDPWDSPSPGASMRRLDPGVPMDVLLDGKYEERNVRAFAIWLAADFPARGKLTPYAESTAAHCFDGKSSYNSQLPGAQFPTSYMAENTDLDHFWSERSLEDLERQKARYLHLKDTMGQTAAKQYLQSIGIKPDGVTLAFDCALLNFPHFDISGLTGMIGEDLMHHELEGLLKFELALMLFYFIHEAILAL